MKQRKLAFWVKKCKFKSRCRLYTETSVTCTKKGGNYCGQYRELTLRLQPKARIAPVENSEDGTSFMVNPDFYEPATAELKEEQ